MEMKALRSVGDDKAQTVLSEITGALLPSPIADPEWLIEARSRGDNSDVRQQVLKEARRILKINPDDMSRQANANLLEFFGNLLSSYALKGADTYRIRQRLGTQGELPPEKFDIAIAKNFQELGKKRGLHTALLKEMMQAPDDVEHLLTDKFVPISLYSKFYKSSQSSDDYIVVAEAVRRGAAVTLSNAWCVYPSDVDLSQAKKPSDILRAFLGVYGLNIVVGASLPSKFFLYQAIPIVSNLPTETSVSLKDYAFDSLAGKPLEVFQENANTISLKIGTETVKVVSLDNPKHHGMEGSFMWRLNRLHIVEIAISYCVDRALYKPDLLKHGVDVRNYSTDFSPNLGLTLETY